MKPVPNSHSFAINALVENMVDPRFEPATRILAASEVLRFAAVSRDLIATVVVPRIK